MRDERLYLNNIKECIERIEEYTIGGKDAFIAIAISKGINTRTVILTSCKLSLIGIATGVVASSLTA